MSTKADEELDHPCRDTCSVWRRGYEKGIREGRWQAMDALRELDESFCTSEWLETYFAEGGKE